MIKKTIYPKTERLGGTSKVVITEKLDGSNIGFFKKDDELYIAQRNNVFSMNEVTKDIAYKGLIGWLEKNGEFLLKELQDNNVIFGEWIGMGKIGYENLDKKFYMFSKGKIDENLEVTKLTYRHESFIYPFKSQQIPDFIGFVPIVSVENKIPLKEELDILYDYYTLKNKRKVEGFVICYEEKILKYVRLKNGLLTDHHS